MEKSCLSSANIRFNSQVGKQSPFKIPMDIIPFSTIFYLHYEQNVFRMVILFTFAARLFCMSAV